MSNDPTLVYPANPITSKTVLTNLVGSVVTWLVVKYGLGEILSQEMQSELATSVAMLIMVGLNIAVRHFWSGSPLSFTAPLSRTESQPLPSGSAVVVSTSPRESAAPASMTPVGFGDQNVNVERPKIYNTAETTPPAVTVTSAR